MIGDHTYDGITKTVDFRHDGLEFGMLFKYDDPHVNDIKNICRR